MDPAWCRKKMHTILELAQCKRIRFHDLRHTFATDCARAGVPVDTVHWLMGHEDIATTANIYQDADRTALRAGLQLLDGSSETPEHQKNSVPPSVPDKGV